MKRYKVMYFTPYQINDKFMTTILKVKHLINLYHVTKHSFMYLKYYFIL